MNDVDSASENVEFIDETTLPILDFIESFALSVADSSVRFTFNSIAKSARDFADRLDLTSSQRDALYSALLAIVDATVKAKKSGKRTAALASEAFEKRVRLIVVASVFAVLTAVALYFGAYETSKITFLCFAALVAPELIDFLRAFFISPRR